MVNKTYPDWYIRAVKNRPFLDSEEYSMLIHDGIEEYNRALKEGNDQRVKKWKDFVLKWLNKRQINKYMLMQQRH